jgi:O-antigen/teichoic acid export membrane protein
LSGMLNAMRLRREAALLQIAERVLIIVLLYALLANFQRRASSVMIALGIASALAVTIRLYIYLRALPGVSGDKLERNHLLKENYREMYVNMLRYSSPFLVWGALSWLQSNGERWVINGMLTAADVGRYGLAANIVNSSAVVLFNILTQFITPIIFDKFSNESHGRTNEGIGLIRLYGWCTFVLFAFTALMLFLFGEQLIRLLSTDAFVVDSSLLAVLTLGIGMFYIGQAQATVGLALKMPTAYIGVKVASAVLSIAFYLAGCYWNGVIGIAMAILIVNSIYFVLTVNVNRSLLHSVQVRH